MYTKRRGCAAISLRVLEEALHFPQDHIITSVRPHPTESGVCQIEVEGPTLPETPINERCSDVEMVCHVTLGEIEQKRIFTTKFEERK